MQQYCMFDDYLWLCRLTMPRGRAYRRRCRGRMRLRQREVGDGWTARVGPPVGWRRYFTKLVRSLSIPYFTKSAIFHQRACSAMNAETVRRTQRPRSTRPILRLVGKDFDPLVSGEGNDHALFVGRQQAPPAQHESILGMLADLIAVWECVRHQVG